MKKNALGYFKYILAADCETSGINFNPKNPADCSENCQAVSWGFIVADAETLKPIEKLYVEIKWDGQSIWSDRAQQIHGLSKEYLEENGLDEEEALEQIANLIIKYWGADTRINLLGHNVQGFDMLFLKRLFRKYDMELKFANRHIDTFSLMFPMLGAFNSEDGFQTIGLGERKQHNAMEDIEFTLETVRRMKLLWNAKIGIKYNSDN